MKKRHIRRWWGNFDWESVLVPPINSRATAAKLGCSISTVNRACVRLNIARQPRTKWKQVRKRWKFNWNTAPWHYTDGTIVRYIRKRTGRKVTRQAVTLRRHLLEAVGKIKVIPVEKRKVIRYNQIRFKKNPIPENFIKKPLPASAPHGNPATI